MEIMVEDVEMFINDDVITNGCLGQKIQADFFLDLVYLFSYKTK